MFAVPAIALAGIPVGTGVAGHVRSTDGLAIPARMAESMARPSGMPGLLRVLGFSAGTSRPHTGSSRRVARAARAGQGATGPRRIARFYLHSRFHWERWQFMYLSRLWERESGWNRYAHNPYSGAYGIPQALPACKMASAGRDWRTDARTQILWGMTYIRERYGTPYSAWRHERLWGWY
jgi:hypothetical protein